MVVKEKFGKVIQTVTSKEVIQLHYLLSEHPELKDLDPISPVGIKDENLLESAISRQIQGYDEYLIYNNVFSNCATLVFGVAKNHSFHNGNKRTALLCLIKHLFKNNYILKSEVSNVMIYKFLTSVATSEGEVNEAKGKVDLKLFALKNDKKLYKSIYLDKKLNRNEADIKFIEKWIKQYSIPKNESNRPIKWAYLIKKLKEFNIDSKIDNNKICLTRKTPVLQFFSKTEKIRTYYYSGEICNKEIIKDIRKTFNLNILDGFDSSLFYDEKIFLDEQIILFKRAIYRLSKN